MPLFLVGFVALIAFLILPYRVWQLHKEGDAGFGDYAFLAFVAFLILSVIYTVITENI
jgi:hypothetical protein